MSEDVLHLCEDGDKGIKQSMHSYQSVGMTHWTPGSDDLHPRIVLGLAPNMFPSSKKTTQASSERVFNEGVVASSKPSVYEGFSNQSFHMFNISGESTRSVTKNHMQVWRPQIDCNVEYNAPTSPQETMNYLKDVGDESLALTRPPEDNIAGSTQIVLFKSDKGKAPMSSSFEDRLLKHPSSTSEFKERVPDASLLRGLSSDNHPRTVFFEEQHQKVNKYFDGGYSLQKVTSPVLDIEGKRVWPGNPAEGFAEDCASFPHSTSRLLGMKRSLLKEKQTFSGTSPGSKFKSKMLSGLLSFPARFGLGQQAMVHLPGSSSESEGNDEVEVVKNSRVQIRNESSAETNTMDMGAFQEQSYLSPSGVNFPSLNMGILAGQDQASEPVGEEVEQRKDFTFLPDVNAVIPSAPAVASSMNNTDQTSSRTQSLDPEHMLSGSEQSRNPVPDPVSTNGTYPRPEPGSTWLKRLKLSAPGSFAVGTKCSTPGEASQHHEKVKLFSNKSVEGSDGSSEPTSRILHDKGKTDDGKARFNLNVVRSSSLASSEKRRDNLLSDSWIRRWSHNSTQEASAQHCEKETTKPESIGGGGGDMKNKQFPSIAAMALMGKVMTGFEPCEFQRRGSFLVWNAKDI